MKLFDAQQSLAFLVSQAAHIEPQVYAKKYPEIQYPNLIPVDTSANEWTKTVTFFSSDKVGAANWFGADSNDVPRADITKDKHEHNIEMAAIGYGYNLEELSSAMLVPGTNLTADRANAARFAYELFMDNLLLKGDASKGFGGLINYAGITAVNAINGAGGSATWLLKTGAEIVRDINTLLTGGYVASNTVEMADTVLLPVEMFLHISSTLLGTNTDTTILNFIQANNTYTALTGQPLTIRAVRGLESAGAGATGRMIAYRRSPDVLKAHIPMPHRFMPVWQTGPMRFDVPGIFRTGGLEIRRSGAVRYMDLINAAA